MPPVRGRSKQGTAIQSQVGKPKARYSIRKTGVRLQSNVQQFKAVPRVSQHCTAGEADTGGFPVKYGKPRH